MDACLIITSEGDRRIPLAGRQYWIIGRGSASDIVIDDVLISRRHAMLQVTDTGQVFLIDFGSRNGSFLNGLRVGVPVKLSDGDRLTFGEASFVFRCSDPSATRGPTSNTIEHTMAMQQRRMLTVVVADIRDFTVLSRALGERKVAELVGAFSRRTGVIIREHSSRIEKYIGDALMAVWFDEDDQHDQNTFRPLSACCAIHRATDELNREFTLPFPMRIGAGVNTGFAMVGNAGSHNHADYTALGDTVNLAFRYESASKQIGCDIVIGELTHQRLTQFTGETPFIQRSVQLKGCEGETTVYSSTFAQLEPFLNQDSLRTRFQGGLQA